MVSLLPHLGQRFQSHPVRLANSSTDCRNALARSIMFMGSLTILGVIRIPRLVFEPFFVKLTHQHTLEPSREIPIVETDNSIECHVVVLR